MKPIHNPFTFGRPSDPLVILHNSQEMKRRSVHGTLIMSVSQAIKFVVQFASQVILARLLLPEDFGLMAMIYPVVGAVQIFNEVGLSQILVFRERLDQQMVSSVFWLNLLLGCVIGSIVIAIAPLAAWFFDEERLTLLIAVAGITIPIGSIGAPSSALLGRQMRYILGSAIGVGVSILGFIATVMTAWAGWGYWSLMFGQICMTAVATMLVWYAVGWSPSAVRKDPEALSVLSFGGNLTGTNLANYLTTSGDNAIIAYTFGSYALGLYDRSYRLVVQPIGQLLTPISNTAAPLLARMRGDVEQYRDSYLAMLQAIILLILPLMITCALFAEEILILLLGERWAVAAPIFTWISVGGLVSAPYASASWLFVSQERVGEMMKVTLIGSVFNLCAFLIGAQYGTAEIAAFGAASFILGNLPLTFIVVTRSGPISLSPIIRLALYQYGLGGLSVLLLIYLRANLEASLLFTVCSALFVSYGAVVIGTFCSGQQRSRLTRTFKFVWESRPSTGKIRKA